MHFLRRAFPALCACAVMGLPAHLVAQDDAGTITGTVADSATGAPIEAATVYLKGFLLRATTNARGEFRLFPVARGPQVVTVVMVGYRAKNAAVQVTAGQVVSAAVVLAPALVELPGLVVTASGSQESQSESPVSIAVVPGNEILDRNVVTADEALRFVPGVSFNNKDMSIRGSSGVADGVGSRVAQLLDGHPILSPDGGQLDFTTIPLLDLERVEVVKGAYSSLYGSSALGGVVNMITKPIATEPQTAFRAAVGVYQTPDQYKFTDGTLARAGVGVQHSRVIRGVGVRGFGGYSHDDGYTDNDQSKQAVFKVKLGSTEGSPRPWDAYALYSWHSYDQFFIWQDSANRFVERPESAGDHDLEHTLLTGATVLPMVRAHTLVQVNPYVNFDSQRNQAPDTSSSAAPGAVIENYHDAVKIGSSATLIFTPGNSRVLTTGIDGGYTHVTSNFLGGRNIGDVAGFAQYEFRPVGRLKLVAGARLDFHQAEGATGEVVPSPKLSAVISASPGATFRASIGRGYRAPSAIEQFVNTTQRGFHVIPNFDLLGEKAWSGELGVTSSHGRFWLDASVFQNNYDDLIAPAAAGLFTFQFQNISRARVRGLEAGLRVSVVRDYLDIQGSYLFLDSEDLDTGESLPYRSKHTATGTFNMFRNRVGVDVQFRSAPDVVLQYPFDEWNNVTLVDLRLSQRLFGAEFQFKVNNLFQVQYVDGQERYPGAPRNFMLTVLHGI